MRTHTNHCERKAHGTRSSCSGDVCWRRFGGICWWFYAGFGMRPYVAVLQEHVPHRNYHPPPETAVTSRCVRQGRTSSALRPDAGERGETIANSFGVAARPCCTKSNVAKSCMTARRYRLTSCTLRSPQCFKPTPGRVWHRSITALLYSRAILLSYLCKN